MITKENYNTSEWKKKDIVLTQITLSIFGIFLGVMIFAVMVLLWSPAAAEGDQPGYRCWVLCQPGSEVLIREKPSKRADVIGAAGSGEKLRTDWKEKNGWLHLIEVSNETGEGWISLEYIVFDEPIWMDAEGVINGKGRVACRKSIGGKRKTWIQPGTSVEVYWISSEWAVTNRGYISCDYLEVP